MTSFATFLLTRLLLNLIISWCVLLLHIHCVPPQICWNIEFQSIGSRFQSDIRSKQVIFSPNFSWLKKFNQRVFPPISFPFLWINKVLFGRKMEISASISVWNWNVPWHFYHTLPLQARAAATSVTTKRKCSKGYELPEFAGIRI